MSLRQELEAEQVQHLDLQRYCLVETGTTVRETLGRMRTEGGRTALITDGAVLVGIFTERDVMRRVIIDPGALDGPVEAVMTPRPITISPDTSAAEALWMMADHHFRNLPVIDAQGNILGDMTYASIIQYLAARYPIEVLNRSPRPEQYPSKPEGGD